MKKHVTPDALRLMALFLICLAVALPTALAQSATPSINRVALLGNEKGMELEITTSHPVQAQTQVLTGPDRILVDFLGALPGAELKGLKINHAGVKAVRAGLFQANPPITRLVIDLETPTQYQLFPSGNTVILKFGASPAGSIVASIRNESSFVPPTPPPPKVRVTYQAGLLSIHAQKATLAEVLFAIHERTGADIGIPAGAEQENVVMDAGPARAKDVLTTLLNGSHFNFVMVGSAKDPDELRSLILTPRVGGDLVASPEVSYASPMLPGQNSDAPVVEEPQPPPPPPPQLLTQPGPPETQPGGLPEQVSPGPPPQPEDAVPANGEGPQF